MEYEVRITVTQEITVAVKADNMLHAKTVAEKNWKNGEYDSSAAHSRLKRENVKYETLYPDNIPMDIPHFNSNITQLSRRKVAEPER